MNTEKKLGLIYIKTSILNFKVLWATTKSVWLNLHWITVGFGVIITYIYDGNMVEGVSVLLGSTLIIAVILALPCTLLSYVLLWRSLKTNEERKTFLKLTDNNKSEAISKNLWT